MAIYKKIDGKDFKIADNPITYHNELSGRTAMNCHPISAIRKLPEKLTELKSKSKANEEAITQEISNREQAIASEAEARNEAIAQEARLRESADTNLSNNINSVRSATERINLEEDRVNRGKLIFTPAVGDPITVQGGFLPDNTSIILTDNNQLQAKGLVTQTGYLSGDVIKEVISAQGGYLDSHNFGTSTPTNQELTDYAIQNIGTITQADEIWDKTRVINLYDHHTWVWDLNSKTWSDLGEIAQISDANNDGLHGLVTGAPNDGYHNYMGNIDANGQININGLPELAEQVISINNSLIDYELTANKTQIIDENSTVEQYPSAAAVYNTLQNTPIKSIDKYEVQDIVTEGMYDTYYTITADTYSTGTIIGNSVIGDNGKAEITIIPNPGYYPRRALTVHGAQYAYDASTGTIVLWQPTMNVTTSTRCVSGYNIEMNVAGGTYSGVYNYKGQDFMYNDGSSLTITITPRAGYSLPSEIHVSGCDYTYNFDNGEIILSNPYDSIVIEVICESSDNPYLTFECNSSFTLNVIDNLKYWDGTIEVNAGNPENSTDWLVWEGTSTVSSGLSSTSGKHNIYVRGTGNTFITGSTANANRAGWVLIPDNGTDLIDCYGNIENLLDYQMIQNGQHPPMANYCFSYIFYSNNYLRTCPAFRAETLTDYCYRSALRNCSELITIPALPALELSYRCYDYMMGSSSKIKISETQDSEYQYEYRIPIEGYGVKDNRGTLRMFSSTGGTFMGDPIINTPYYTSNDIVR